MEKFAVSSIKIKSSWFDSNRKKKSVFKKMGKDEGLNLYLQLFRFRVHQGSKDEHYFITSIGSLVKYTKVNIKTKLSKKDIHKLLKQMDHAGVIELQNYKRWDTLLDEKGNVYDDKMIILKATDVPNVYNEDIDIPKTEDDYYIPVSFDLINHMYEQDLTSKAVTIYLLVRKLSNSSAERKAWININTIKNWLGFGNDTIKDCLIDLNKLGVVATNVRNKKGGIKFEHYAVFGGLKNLEQHKQDNLDVISKFLKRYNEDTVSEDPLPFEEIEETEIDDGWGIPPVGYRTEHEL
ncbi:hypothetical protein [Piscibacillus salipiscarius]|uniref:Replication protein n=1 Tax=Piscibacillus salipiscarius TaxID=299480 RepID=A0ABW5Q983_9BACI|nr:hypothetical protein [Piscibacillus salipiscarius]